jgi:hypothetical protein
MGVHLGLNLLACDPADNMLGDGGDGAGYFGGYIRQLLEMVSRAHEQTVCATSNTPIML